MKHSIAEIESVMAASKRQFLEENRRTGETYVGILLGENGAPDEHLWLMPGEIEDADWEKCMAWAKSIGGELPSRREQRLLYVNAKDAFKKKWHWSREQHAVNSANAFGQVFGGGSQDWGHKSLTGSARAIRRSVI